MRIALAPINPTIGDVEGNTSLARDAIAAARSLGADLVVLPELCLSGYPPKDLLMQEGFVAACEAAAASLGESATEGLTAIFGCPVRARGGGVGNALLAYRDGARVGVYHKRLLPTYDVFDEDRYFVPGDKAVVIDVPTRKGPVERVGLSICEDLWRGDDAGFGWRYRASPDPVAELAAAGAAIIVSPSASPFVLGKGRRHHEIVRGHAARHKVLVASVNQLGGNDELVFDGHCFAYGPDGLPITEGLLFREGMVAFETSPEARPRGLVQGTVPDHLAHTDLASHPDTAAPDAAPELLLYEALVLGVRDYLKKTGFRAALIGLSGGIDSALTAALARAALSPRHVVGVSMPGTYSSEHSRQDAHDLAQRLDIECVTIPIDAPVDGFRAAIDPCLREHRQKTLGEQLPDLAEENLQSRVRGTILMALSNRIGAIVLTTGNKSELGVGYCTLYGDMNGGLAVLSDVSKQWVYRLSRWMNEHHAACGFPRPPIPERSITKPPSAELRPDQTDQDSLPPYEVLDEILERHVERRQSPETIVRETSFDETLVRRVVRMVAIAEYKRWQTAVGLKVTSVAFGSGRRWPIAQKWKG